MDSGRFDVERETDWMLATIWSGCCWTRRNIWVHQGTISWLSVETYFPSTNWRLQEQMTHKITWRDAVELNFQKVEAWKKKTKSFLKVGEAQLLECRKHSGNQRSLVPLYLATMTSIDSSLLSSCRKMFAPQFQTLEKAGCDPPWEHCQWNQLTGRCVSSGEGTVVFRT